MDDLWAVLGALAAFVLPMALAWWLLRGPRGGERPPSRSHGKMPAEKER